MSYQLNNLKRPVLITAAEVIFHAPTKHTLDERIIENSIIIAEERFILPLLGAAFYNVIAGQKNVLITAENIETYQQRIADAGYQYPIQAGDVLNSAEFLSVPNRALWDMHLWKLIAECVALTALPESYVQLSSEGAIFNQPTSSPMGGGGVVTPGLQSMKWAMDTKMQTRIDPLMMATENYLRANRASFPLFPVPDVCEAEETPVLTKKTNIILNVYDD